MYMSIKKIKENSSNITNKYVVVQRFVGLGNRLRTIAAALEYAERNNRTLCINWSDGMFGPIGKDAYSLYFI